MPSPIVILLAVFGACILGGAAWVLWVRRPAKNKPKKRPARAKKAEQVSASREGSSDVERIAWVIGKMTGTPPRKIPASRALGELLAQVDRVEFARAVGQEFKTTVELDETNLGMTVGQFAHYARHLKRGQKNEKPKGRKRSPRVAGDIMLEFPPALLALASELGVRREWDLDKARLHVTKEYMRWNARIHLASKEAERTTVQARLEQIGQLREALAPVRRP